MVSTAIRQSVIAHARHVVVKIGTQLLTDAKGQIDPKYVAGMADQIATLRQRDINVTVVSSGAVGVGLKTLSIKKRPDDISAIQAVAAVGQSGLMAHWRAAFEPHKLHVAQMLLTRSDFEARARYLNIRNCITELHSLNAVPIINENDTVSVDEIRVGDNDILAALVTNALRANLLVLLSNVDGLKDADGKPVELVEDVHASRGLVLKEKSELGSGGMSTKLEAARIVTDAGEVAVIANGRTEDVLVKLLAGEKVGTVFVPAARKLDSRERWIGMTVRPAGTLVVDDGAAKALVEKGTSLLAIGITEITGQFGKGDVVVVRDQRGREIARGLINYDADECRAIKGHKSSEFEKLLGRRAYDEVVHRDNMVLTPRGN